MILFDLGDDDIAEFKILPHLFQPVCSVIKKINGSSTRITHRPSVLEQEAAFIVNIIVSININ